MRMVLGAVGVTMLGYGGWLLLSAQQVDQVREVVVWAAVAVIVHDLLVVPLALALGWLVRSRLRRSRTAEAGLAAKVAVVVLVVVGPATLAAIPVLGRFGAGPDRETLLERSYAAGWFAVLGAAVIVGIVLAGSGLLSPLERGRRRHAQGPRRR